MPINESDGLFSVGYWLDPEDEGEEDEAEYGDTEEEITDRAILVIKAGRYKYAITYKFENDDWSEIEHITPDNIRQK